MNPVNTNYNLTLEIKSPVFIGTSQEKNWMRNIDFIHFDGKVYILNQARLFMDMDDAQQDKYTSLITKNRFRDLERFLTDDFDLADYADTVFDYEGTLDGNEIKPLIRGGNGQPYIPGSSIKGAISSSLFGHLYQRLHIKGVHDDLSKQLLGGFDKALGRFIRPYDTTTSIATEISDVNLFNLRQQYGNWEAGFKENFRILLESFKPKTKTTFRLSLADGLGNFLRKRGQQSNNSFLPTNYGAVFNGRPLETLFSIINTQTKQHLAKELTFFQTYDQDDDVAEIIDQIEFLQGLTKTPNACLLRMSGGSGFHAITGDWRFDDHLQTIEQPDRKNMVYNHKIRGKEPARYKSRRVAYPFKELMGFVQLSKSD